MRIDHADPLPRYFQGCDGTVHRCTEGDHPVHGSRNLHHGDVTGKGAATVHGLGFTQMGRKIIGISLLHAFPNIRTHEEPLVEENAGILRRTVGCGTFRVEMMEMNPTQFSRPAAQGVYQDMRYAGNAGEVDMIPAPNRPDRLVSRYESKLLHLEKSANIAIFFVYL